MVEFTRYVDLAGGEKTRVGYTEAPSKDKTFILRFNLLMIVGGALLLTLRLGIFF